MFGAMAELGSAGLAPRTQARRLSALRQFHKFLYSDGYRNDDPSSNIDSPQQGQALPKFLSIEEIDRLIIAATNHPGVKGKRLLAMVELMYATGMRVSELVELTFAAASRDPQMLIVRGKGSKERLVPLSDPARDALRDYLEVRDAFIPSDKSAGHADRPGQSSYLSRRAGKPGI